MNERGIAYIDEFKIIFIADRYKGKLLIQLFVDCGFDIELLGHEQIKSASKIWQKAYRESGELGLRNTINLLTMKINVFIVINKI